MSYTVLARKYRPAAFADMVGQEHVSRTLGNAITSGRVAHAFLFTGPRGVGKTTTARLLAKALNCERGPRPEPCNECDACREIAQGVDIDVLEIDGASNNSIDDVRRLQETLPFRPARDRFKVVIVDEVHMLSLGAFNAFLKTLEEPPEHVKFVFATTEIHKVPITIRSRCQRYDFRLIPQAVISAQLRTILNNEQIEADDAAIALVAREGAGSMRDALTALDQVLALGAERLEVDTVAQALGVAARKVIWATLAAVLSGDPAGCLARVNEIAEQGFDILHFTRQLLECTRDLTVLKVVGPDHELLELAPEERQVAQQLAAAHAQQELERLFSGLNALTEEVGLSTLPKLVLEMGLLRLSDRPPLLPLAELLDRLAGLESKLGPAAGGGSGKPGASRSAAGSGGSPPSGGGSRATEVEGGVARAPDGPNGRGSARGLAEVTNVTPPTAESNGRPSNPAALAPLHATIDGRGAATAVERAALESKPRTPQPLAAREHTPEPPRITHAPPSAANVPAKHASAPAPTQPLSAAAAPAPLDAPPADPDIHAVMPPSAAAWNPPVTPQPLAADAGARLQQPAATHAGAGLPPPSAANPSAPPPSAADREAPAGLPGMLGGDWLRLVTLLKHSQPGLAAVLDHGTPLEVNVRRLKIGFPEGSFFGRQAQSASARAGILRAAEQVFGGAPELSFVRSDDPGGQQTLAAAEATHRKARQAGRREAALRHPRVQEALEVFGESENSVEINVDME